MIQEANKRLQAPSMSTVAMTPAGLSVTGICLQGDEVGQLWYQFQYPGLSCMRRADNFVFHQRHTQFLASRRHDLQRFVTLK